MSAAFEKLAASAPELNAASDELAKPIHAIDGDLQTLNLGVAAWVRFEGHSDENDYLWDRSLGYAKVSGIWGIAIRTREGFPDDYKLEEWRFNDAPRSYRLKALEKLPELLETLAKNASKTAAALKSKVAVTKQVATTISQLASVNPLRRK